MRFLLLYNAHHISHLLTILFSPLFLTISSYSAAPPAIPGDDAFVDANEEEAQAPDGRQKRALENRANAAAAAKGVTETRNGPDQRKKKKRHVDAQESIDQLLASRRTDSTKMVNLVGELKESIKGSPGKKKRDSHEQHNRLILQVQQSAINNRTLGLDAAYAADMVKLGELIADRDAVAAPADAPANDQP